LTQIKLRAVGSSIWVTGDDSPFWVSEPPDIAVQKIEDALEAQERFVVLTGHHFKWSEDSGRDEEVAQRSFYLRPTMVVAVSQRLVEDDDD
jgi:hypothetical protein